MPDLGRSRQKRVHLGRNGHKDCSLGLSPNPDKILPKFEGVIQNPDKSSTVFVRENPDKKLGGGDFGIKPRNRLSGVL